MMVLHTLKTSISHVTHIAEKGYAEYMVQAIDRRGAWVLCRRYSHFRELRNALRSIPLCTSCTSLVANNSITKRFPRRRLFSSNAQRTLDERCARLARFLDVVTLGVRVCGDASCMARDLVHSFLVMPHEEPGQGVLHPRRDSIPLLTESPASFANDELPVLDALPVLGYTKKDRPRAKLVVRPVEAPKVAMRTRIARLWQQRPVTKPFRSRTTMEVTLATIQEGHPDDTSPSL
ncbi:hypothetical protein SPRG_07922 [Saprolegnia parasitica CBS 223.65]|uniref:PX domain-containing protein n=1 Tax=Saprolegnia parasitica (strain CBS 223.65) TaxID=695850 RepID=A0A067CBF9_SAPPC|nr:hypothetical protein SPRG_07922 [Saprolegnia parasitica CBS 223.65]KDO26520.1 hypothetical protein SPRG_07922 [Saprolegnia parasitica CBS 223.65]|eukprot:XP_012202664.1 hypothetical protein SPRG_07922 [Saprolegnia parasitica CBS 223.65]